MRSLDWLLYSLSILVLVLAACIAAQTINAISIDQTRVQNPFE
jgi:hypothetical protein